jgi:hypothetical protein
MRLFKTVNLLWQFNNKSKAWKGKQVKSSFENGSHYDLPPKACDATSGVTALYSTFDTTALRRAHTEQTAESQSFNGLVTWRSSGAQAQHAV